MTCDRYQELLSASLDGELTEAEDSLLREHLPECPECRHTLCTMQELDSQLRGVRRAIQPADLRSRVSAVVRARCGEIERWHFGLSFHRARASRSEYRSSPGPMIGPWGRA